MSDLIQADAMLIADVAALKQFVMQDAQLLIGDGVGGYHGLTDLHDVLPVPSLAAIAAAQDKEVDRKRREKLSRDSEKTEFGYYGALNRHQKRRHERSLPRSKAGKAL